LPVDRPGQQVRPGGESLPSRRTRAGAATTDPPAISTQAAAGRVGEHDVAWLRAPVRLLWRSSTTDRNRDRGAAVRRETRTARPTSRERRSSRAPLLIDSTPWEVSSSTVIERGGVPRQWAGSPRRPDPAAWPAKRAMPRSAPRVRRARPWPLPPEPHRAAPQAASDDREVGSTRANANERRLSSPSDATTSVAMPERVPSVNATSPRSITRDHAVLQTSRGRRAEHPHSQRLSWRRGPPARGSRAATRSLPVRRTAARIASPSASGNSSQRSAAEPRTTRPDRPGARAAAHRSRAARGAPRPDTVSMLIAAPAPAGPPPVQAAQASGPSLPTGRLRIARDDQRAAHPFRPRPGDRQSQPAPPADASISPTARRSTASPRPPCTRR